MRILFLNQYFPPDPAPTGILFRELADSLEAEGHVVDFVAARERYREGQARTGRMKRELMALGSMLLDGLQRPKADLVISGSSPPCVLVAATLIAAFHRAKSVNWAMDLYPEIAVTLGEVREGFLSRCLRSLMGWAYRRTDRVVVLDEDMAECLRGYGVKAACIRPWVFHSVLPQLAIANEAPDSEWTWIYSGNLGRAHEWETLLEAQALLENQGSQARLVFQGGGPARPAAQARAEELGLKHCLWTGYVEEEDLPQSLLRGSVLAVTQLPAVKGMLWPSKLALLLSLPRAILWVGPENGATARMLKRLPSAGVFAPGQVREIADWLASRQSMGAESVTRAVHAAAHREESLERWRALVATVFEKGLAAGHTSDTCAAIADTPPG
jgi:colanic acid biosynthesis glycosyl transferase WcaI